MCSTTHKSDETPPSSVEATTKLPMKRCQSCSIGSINHLNSQTGDMENIAPEIEWGK